MAVVPDKVRRTGTTGISIAVEGSQMLYCTSRVFYLCALCSGPKRYDVIKGRWRYSHDGSALHDLLSSEFSELLDSMVDLSDLKYSHIVNDGDSWS